MNKTILIAGCNGIVGKTAAQLFSERGWITIGIDRTDTSDAIVNQYFQADIRKQADVESAIAKIEQESAINALFNTAGYEINKGFEEISYKEWSDLLDTILGGAANLCRAVAPKMVQRKNGKIILLSPDYSKDEGENVLSATAASTLYGFGKSFGVEMAAENVLVNILSANTPFNLKNVIETAYYLADKDTYTAAQIVSVSGEKK